MIQNITDAISTYPVQVIGIMVLLPILMLMCYEYWYNKKHELEKRVKTYLEKDTDKKFIDVAVRETNKYLGDKGDKIQLKLERSNILFKKEEYLTFMIAGMIIGALAGFILFPFGGAFKSLVSFIDAPLIQIFFARLLAAAAFSFVGYFTPEVWIQYLIIDRRRLLDEQIEDAMLQVAEALRAGSGINLAIKLAGDELKYPMKDEFTRAYQEISAGKSFNDAMDDLKDRVNLKDFTMAINAIQIQYETGAELEPLLREIVKTVGDRKILKKELQKQITSSKGTAIILMTAPLLFSIAFSSMNAESYGQMTKTPLGIVMILVGIVSYLIGSAIILKILKDISKLT